MKLSKYNPIIILISMSLFLLSCENFFIQEMEIPRQELDNQLAVHSFINETDTQLHFEISRNFGLDDQFPLEDQVIENAEVTIYKNGEYFSKFGQNAEGHYAITLEDEIGGADQEFRVEISHPDYDLALVETKMPTYVGPNSVEFFKDGGFPDPTGEEPQDLIQIEIEDPGDEENYYEFQVHRILVSSDTLIFGADTLVTTKTYPDRYFSPDSNIEQGISGFLLSDSFFNGEKYVIQIMLIDNLGLEDIPVEKLKITWNSISKDHYQYSKSLLQYQRSSGFGLFSDPIAIYSNVENGLGMVSFRSSRILSMDN